MGRLGRHGGSLRHLTHLLTTAASDGAASPGDRGQKARKGQERGRRAGLHGSRVGGWGADSNLASKKSPKYGIKMTATRKHWRPAEGNDVKTPPCGIQRLTASEWTPARAPVGTAPSVSPSSLHLQPAALASYSAAARATTAGQESRPAPFLTAAGRWASGSCDAPVIFR